KYVVQLEERLGIQLLNRTTRSVSLTDNGRAYLEPCRRLLDDFDDLETTTLHRNAMPRGHIRMTAPLTIGEIYLPEMIADFTALYPDVSIDLVLSDRFVNLVDEGFDLAIRSGKLETSNLVAKRLASMSLIVCASPDYLTAHGRPERPEDLQRHTCIIDMNHRNGARWAFDVNGRQIRIEVQGPISINSAIATRALAIKGRGIGLCPSFVVNDDLKNGRLVRLLSTFDREPDGLFVLYPQSRHLAPKIRLLIDFFVQRFRGF
ncbi:MAG: LysR substrate-binding domain-containing protein, partial [Alphaproteobacteria bacterium]